MEISERDPRMVLFDELLRLGLKKRNAGPIALDAGSQIDNNRTLGSLCSLWANHTITRLFLGVVQRPVKLD
jgi:hypothetical protein